MWGTIGTDVAMFSLWILKAWEKCFKLSIRRNISRCLNEEKDKSLGEELLNITSIRRQIPLSVLILMCCTEGT